MENESDVRTRLLEAASSLARAIDDEIKTLEIETDHLEELIYKATARFRGQSLTVDSDLDSRLAFGGLSLIHI